MPVGAAIGGVVGGGLSAYGAMSAANTQAKAAKQAQKTMLPFTQTGTGTIYSLAELYGIPTPKNPNPGGAFNEASLATFQKTPGYQFAFSEGMNALQNSAAAKGMLQSGNTLRDLVTYGQGAASQLAFQPYVNSLMQLAQLGQGAAGNTAQLQLNQGAAQASGLVGATNAINSSLGNVGNTLLFHNALKSLGSGSAYGSLAGAGGAGGGITYMPAGPGELPWLT